MTLEEFEGWTHQRETREVKDFLVALRDNYSELLHNLMSNCNSAEEMSIQGARLQGMIVGINSLLEIEWGDVGGEDEA